MNYSFWILTLHSGHEVDKEPRLTETYGAHDVVQRNLEFRLPIQF